jgi:hypothetical protein
VCVSAATKSRIASRTKLADRTRDWKGTRLTVVEAEGTRLGRAWVAALFALSPLAFRRSPLVRIAAYLYAAIMTLNGAGHLMGSIYLQRWAPGTTTAPS